MVELAKLCCWVGVAAALLSLGTGPALALLPPEQLQQKNLTATEIIIGRVAEVRSAPPELRPLLPPLPAGTAYYFILQPIHVVKTSLSREQLQELQVLFLVPEPAPSGLGQRHQGWLPVQVGPGELVIVYATAVRQGGQTLLLPLLAGASVIRLAPEPLHQPAPDRP